MPSISMSPPPPSQEQQLRMNMVNILPDNNPARMKNVWSSFLTTCRSIFHIEMFQVITIKISPILPFIIRNLLVQFHWDPLIYTRYSADFKCLLTTIQPLQHPPLPGAPCNYSIAILHLPWGITLSFQQQLEFCPSFNKSKLKYLPPSLMQIWFIVRFELLLSTMYFFFSPVCTMVSWSSSTLNQWTDFTDMFPSTNAASNLISSPLNTSLLVNFFGIAVIINKRHSKTMNHSHGKPSPIN